MKKSIIQNSKRLKNTLRNSCHLNPLNKIYGIKWRNKKLKSRKIYLEVQNNKCFILNDIICIHHLFTNNVSHDIGIIVISNITN